MVHRGTTVGSNKFSSLMVDTQGKLDHDTLSSKKVSELISNMGAGNPDEGDENVIEEDD